MGLDKVLHMKGGTGETSYAQTAHVARRAISMTKPRREEAIAQLIAKDELIQNDKTTLCIADLGCASGPNTLMVVSDIIITSERIRKKSGRANQLEYQIYLNDLPGNDFNTVFQSLPKFHEDIKEQVGLETGQFFVGAMPGSFYGRLFPSLSLHFVHSSYSLHWLSQVPNGLEDNKRNIYISITSPKSVLKAYKEQFEKDTQLFLKSRSAEVIKGGKMLLMYMGRSNEDPISESYFVLESLAHVLSELVSQRILEEEKLEAFNVPIYHASSAEVIEEVQKEGSFYINGIDVCRVSINNQENGSITLNELAYKISKLMRAIFESILVSHFGEAITDEIFLRLSSVIEDGASKRNILDTNVIISLTKK